MSESLILVFAAAYLLGLFVLARWGERRALSSAIQGRTRAVVHGLALGVYCSTWTVFGAIGSAVREGYAYLPIYLGPLLLALLAPWLWERLVRLKQRHRLASIADLLGARYGGSKLLPAVVALLCLATVVPYVALQLTAIGGALRALGVQSAVVWVLAFALLMVLFTLRFGVRDARTMVERPGLVLVLGIESAVKLVVLLGLSLWAWSISADAPLDWHAALAARAPYQPLTLLGQTLLAAAASILLPRMFQIGVVECADVAELSLARRVFAGYLVLVSIAVLPLAALAIATMGSGSSDYLLISMPLQRGNEVLALLAFVAGLSAASAMMIAAWLALSTMLSNDLLVPLLLRGGVQVSAPRVLQVRRFAVVLTATMSSLWYLGSGAATLVQMGLLAFAGVAQCFPALLAALYAPRSSANAVTAAVVVGALSWLLLLLLPALQGVALTTAEITARAMLALALNLATLLALSARYPASLRARLTAARFLSGTHVAADALAASIAVRADDLYVLLERLLGSAHFRTALQAQFGAALPAPQVAATPGVLAAAERAVAEVFGSASARELLARGLSGRALDMDQVLSALDQSSTRLRVGAQLLNATFDHMHQAVSVVDAELQLAAWNRRYELLFDWPPGLLTPGRPIADLIQHAARASGLDDAQTQARIARRLAQLRAATPYRSVRNLPDGRTLDVRGEPLPEGGFVTTFFDISESVNAARALEEANIRLEERVAARTRELQRQGELKNQFLAAASHDLLQPLSAARLYLAAAQSQAGEERSLLERADAALAASEELLSGLTDLARLDSGALKPQISAVDLDQLLISLSAQLQALAQQRGLRLRVRKSNAWVSSDPRLLRRIVQNYLANAVRYTARGGVLLGVRRDGAHGLRIVVSDTGPGIDAATLPRLFGTLERSAAISPWGERGLGLGLAGCKRLADVLGHAVRVASRVDRGSSFSVTVPRVSAPTIQPDPQAGPISRLRSLKILCIDDNAEVRSALEVLLKRWGATVWLAESVEQAKAVLAAQAIDVVLVDFALGADVPDGLALIQTLQATFPALKFALVTAETDPALPALAAAQAVPMLRKPVRPAALRALLESWC